MSDRRDEAVVAMKKAIAGILNIACDELPDGGKIALAETLQRNAGSLRIHIALEPFTVLGMVMPKDRTIKPVELFRIEEGASKEIH